MNFALVTGASLLTVIVVHGATFFIARRVGRYNVVDIVGASLAYTVFRSPPAPGPGGADSPSLVR